MSFFHHLIMTEKLLKKKNQFDIKVSIGSVSMYLDATFTLAHATYLMSDVLDLRKAHALSQLSSIVVVASSSGAGMLYKVDRLLKK